MSAEDDEWASVYDSEAVKANVIDDDDDQWAAVFQNEIDDVQVPVLGRPTGSTCHPSNAQSEQFPTSETMTKTKTDCRTGLGVGPKPKGRPKGTWGGAILRKLLSTMEDPKQDSARTAGKGSIEYARECKKQVDQERQKAVAKHYGKQDSCTKNTGTDLALAEYIQHYGIMSAFSEEQREPHRSMYNCMVACHKQSLVGVEDSLVTHQLENSMSTMSARALSKQLGQTQVGNRMLSIAGAFVIMAGSLSF